MGNFNSRGGIIVLFLNSLCPAAGTTRTGKEIITQVTGLQAGVRAFRERNTLRW